MQYDATRYMYIIVEAPEFIVRGEQIGVRVTVFNYWYNDDFIEVSGDTFSTQDSTGLLIAHLDSTRNFEAE